MQFTRLYVRAMTNAAMRFIDYWLGIPLCFCLSLTNLFLKTVSGLQQKQGACQRILFIKLSEIGAIILAYPLLERVRADCLESELFFLTFRRNEEILKMLGGVIANKNVITIRDDSMFGFIVDTLAAAKRMRQERIDIVFDLEFFSRFTCILSFVSGAGKRIGFYGYTFEGLYRGNLLTHRIQYNPLAHISKTYASLYQVIRVETKCSPELREKVPEENIVLPRYVSDAGLRDQIWNILQESGVRKDNRLILINPGEGNLPLREWPLENFVALCKKLLQDTGNCIVIIGAKNSFQKEKILYAGLASKRVINLVDKTTLAELMELFCISDALVANDCGLAHIAALTPIKKFILFGPESPRVFRPLGENTWIVYSGQACSPCLSAFNHRNSACRDNLCLKTVTPDDVYALIQRNL